MSFEVHGSSEVEQPVAKTEQSVMELAKSEISPEAEKPVNFVFKEMLSDDEDAVPTFDELERFGLFDQSICPASLAEYRARYPLPQENSVVVTTEPASPPRPSPQHRHSIAIAPTSLPPAEDTSSIYPPLASPGLATASTRLSPFSLTRRPSRKDRPSQSRTKSSNDVQRASIPPLLTPEDQMPISEKRASIASFESLRTDDTPLASARVSLDRDSTIKEKRAPRKLKRAAPPKPILPVIRTDDDFLLRPSSEFRASSQSPSQSPKTSPAVARKSVWRQSLASLVSPVPSPTSFEVPRELPPRQPRSPSPIGAFPSTVRRESNLPAVERSRKDSLSDSYLGDSENSKLNLPGRERSNTVSSIPSPSSPVSTGNLWARALKMGRRGNNSRASSVASSSASTTSWDVVEGDSIGDKEYQGRRTFEVVRKPLPPRPQARRTHSEANVHKDLPEPIEGFDLTTSTSSPNLSKITEYPESLDQRVLHHPYSQTRSPSASFESLPISQGFVTPPITANSSKTVLALGGSDSTPTGTITARRIRSRSALSNGAPPAGEIVPIDELELLVSSSHPLRSRKTDISTRTRSDSNASLPSTYRSTQSHSSSRDSLFSSPGQHETPASSSSADFDDGEVTGCTSATDDEHGTQENAAVLLNDKRIEIEPRQVTLTF